MKSANRSAGAGVVAAQGPARHGQDEEGARTKREVVKDVAQVTLGSYIAQVLGFVTAIAMRRFLEPQAMGIWTTLKVILSYGSFTSLGVSKASSRDIPYYEAKGDHETVAKLRNVTFTVNTVVSALCAAGLVAYAFLGPFAAKPVVRDGLCVIALLVVLERFYSYYTTILRAEKAFGIVSRMTVWEAAVELAMVVVLVRRFGLYGLYGGTVLAFLINTWQLHAMAKRRFRLDLDLARMWAMMKLGISLSLLAFLVTFLRSLDKVMIAKHLGAEAVGHFSIALMVSNFAFNVANLVGIVMYPRFMEAYGRSGEAAGMAPFLTGGLRALGLALPAGFAILAWVFPALFVHLLPKYVPGIPSLKVLLVATYVYSLTLLPAQFCVAQDRQKVAIALVAATTALAWAFCRTAIAWGLGIVGVCWAMAAAYLVLYVALLGFTVRAFASSRAWAGLLAETLAPPLYMLGVFWAVERSWPVTGSAPSFCMGLVVLVGSALPLLWILDRRTGIVRLLAGSAWARVRRASSAPGSWTGEP